jgi:predicted ATPase
MIRAIEALNYRCLRHVRQTLGPFHVLVGPNASGKSTFLDVVAFLGRLVRDGLDAAVSERTSNFYDLVWGRSGARFELAIEACVAPDGEPDSASPLHFDTVRYECAVSIDGGLVRLASEDLLVGGSSRLRSSPRTAGARTPGSLARGSSRDGWRSLVSAVNGLYEIETETSASLGGSRTFYRFPRQPDRSVLSFFNVDDRDLPVVSRLTRTLKEGVARVDLDNRALRAPSAPGQGQGLRVDGSGLPWVISELSKRNPERFRDWMAHVKLALPGLQAVRVVERPEDRHKYVMLRYPGRLDVPSWMLSDGTLRFLALTVLPYASRCEGTFFVEEPENSIHPLNVQLVMQSLTSVYQGQVLLATHSPAVVADARLDQILVVENDRRRGTRLIEGPRHPLLVDWKGTPSLPHLFAGGILG